MKRLMVVEDELLIARDIAESLMAMGYEVTGMAQTAEECVQGAAEQRPDLVLMDINLAGELDGVEAARLLRERFDVPVVYLTALADEETLGRAKRTDPLGYLTKPFRKAELRSAVEIGLCRHKTERELRDREQRSSATLRAINDAIFVVDPARRVSFMNGAAEELVGQRENDVRGHLLSEIFRLLNEKTRAPIEDPVQLALERRSVVQLPPGTAVRLRDRELPVEDSVKPIMDEHGAVLGAVVVVRDASESRKTEQQLALANRLSSLGTIAASVAHEINNPLTYIMSNASCVLQDLCRMEAQLSSPIAANGDRDQLRSRLAQATALLGEVEDGARRIGRIVADLTVFARKEPDTKRGDVIAALKWALRVSHSTVKHHARVTTRFDPVPHVRGDAVRLGQIFLNLVLNASHAMSGKPFEENELFVAAEVDEDGLVAVTVRDTGAGMTAEVIERIFDPFFTTKTASKGTGLGLSVCRRAVRAMGGSISVGSELGQGTTFVVRLPAAEAVTSDVPAVPETRARVLVIDDDGRVLAALRRMLASVHDVATAPSAVEALHRIDSGERYDVILCDLAMPEMDGMELYDQLRVRAAELSRRIVFVTGGASSAPAAQFIRRHDVLMKPVTRNDLLHAIDRKLRVAPANADAPQALDGLRGADERKCAGAS